MRTIRTKYQIQEALAAQRPDRPVPIDVIHDVLWEVADDLDCEISAGVGLAVIVQELRHAEVGALRLRPAADADAAALSLARDFIRTVMGQEGGEDLVSLRALVKTVNDAERLLVGDHPPFRSSTRAGFVWNLARRVEELEDLRDAAEAKASRPPSLERGLDAHRRELQSGIAQAVTELREASSWPDDARQVASRLEELISAVGSK